MKTILVVDDDANIRLLLRDDLWEKGYNVITAVDGDEAVVSFAEEHVDLVILDIRMPKLNGIEVLKIIRGAKSDVPVIIYTANPDDLEDLSPYGNTCKITKSSKLEELTNRVEKILNA
ncbi:MAG: response regulator [Calditerrivibrio sp.]|nr:response regulator [Calditerrivibrio sp.]MCA1932138.1 response regulator [Calditerrivibrio sp.]MCA1981193.1 response regulator [Calditerrivibrio sp.]